jgi:peptide/nickel transport system substrate-binding protein
MKLGNLRSALLVSIFPVILAMLAILCAGPASAAPEPGTVTIVLNAEPTDLDPNTYESSIEGQVMMGNIMEPLVEMNPDDSSIIPRLATSWKQIDKTTWHFFLRKGVKFHDGTDFNAESVIFSIKRLFNKSLPSSARSQSFAGVTMEGKALDNHTVEIKTGKFEPLLPTLMVQIAICPPSTPMDKLIRNPIGTGPYKFVKWDSGVQIIVERFDGYWGKQPQVKKAVYLWRGESSVRSAMVGIGEADLTPEITKQDATSPDMDYSYLNSETSSLRIGGVWEPPLNDKRFRMALNLAVDRNAMRGSILSKDVIPATQPIVPSIFGHNPDLKVWPYDPQKARQLLDQARKDGVPVDKEITIVGRTGVWPGGDETMEAVMTMYKAVGLNVKLRMLESGAFAPYRDKPYPTNIGAYLLQKQDDNSRGDAAFTVFQKYHCNGFQSPVCDKALDGLIEKAQVAIGEERKNLWRSVFKNIYEEIIPDVMLYHMIGYARIGKRINFKPTMATVNEIPIEQITFK